MPEVCYGRIIGTAGTRFIATFALPDKGLEVNFTANCSSSVKPFSCGEATVTYNDISDLTATHTFFGQLGPNNIKLIVDNGPVVEGVLDAPVYPASSLSGSFVWSAKKVDLCD